MIGRGYPLGVVRKGLSTHDREGISTRGGEGGDIHQGEGRDTPS